MIWIQRREFITLLGGAAAAGRRGAGAAASDAGGRLSGRESAADAEQLLDGFRQGLKEAGYIEDQNVTIEYRCPEGKYDRLPALAADWFIAR